jgi:hypothetical protein
VSQSIVDALEVIDVEQQERSIASERLESR